MSSDTSSAHSDAASTSAPEELTFNLQVVSPSVGVTSPLQFPNISASTTIKELKERIRQSLPLRPADDQQRLIHRGRALGRETDTLLNILGEGAARSHEQHTMHLVLREPASSHPLPTASTTTTTRGHSPAPAPTPTSAQRAAPPVLPQLGPQPPNGFLRTPAQPTTSSFLSLGGGGGGGSGGIGSNHTHPAGHQPNDPIASMHQHHFLPHAQPQAQHNPLSQQQAPGLPNTPQQMASWLSQLQRESMNRNLAQGQRTRASMGMRGIGDNGAQEANSGRASPALGHYYRETVGPNGQTYQVETIIRGNSANPSHGGLSPADVQNLLRSADISQMTAAMNNGIHRSASNSSLHNRFTNPGVTVSTHPTAESRNASGRATPDLSVRSVSGGHHDAWQQHTPARGGVDVYILSSPEGPRALLVNNTTSETYYSPRLRSQASQTRLRNFANFTSPTSTVSDHPMQPNRHEDAQQRQQHPQPQAHQQPQEGQALNPEPVRIGEGLGHPQNPQAGLPPLLIQAGPHIWLLIRLGIFVWLFTTPNSSWSRWLSIIGLAIFVFVVNIGVLNNAAVGAWRPLLQQLQNMLPRLENQQLGQDDHQARREGGQGQEQRGEGEGNAREPNPADIAERLVAQHRERPGWFRGQLRRIERASLLFLASLAPGVAEEHIANLENEARAERQRREAEAAEAARQAEAQAEPSATGADVEGETNTTGTPQGQEERGNEQQPRGNEQAQAPLIAI